MLLVVDAGNSQVTLGVYDDDNLIYRWGLSSKRSYTIDEYGIMISNLLVQAGVKQNIKGIIISSVVSYLTSILKYAFERYFQISPMVVNHELNLNGLILNVERPEEVGADRLCNIIAADRFYKPPFVVVDMGTATTFDIVNDQKEFIGGAICAGIGMSVDALASSTSLLPEIDVTYATEVIARNTVTNILAGSVSGMLPWLKGC